MLTFLTDWFAVKGIPIVWAQILASTAGIAAILFIGWAGYFLARRPALALLKRLIGRTSSRIDDNLLEAGFFNRLSLLVPGLIIYALMPVVFPEQPIAVTFIQNAFLIYLIIAVFFALDALLNAINQSYEEIPASNQIPIKSFLQGIKIVLAMISFIMIIAVVLDKTPFYLLSGLGALTAVLMLIFKDAILGFVAGIQLATNKMVSKGDWISMPQYGADGDVIDVALTTVKVQNWDKTVTTIPTYALINDSFRNWRGMFEAGGRRIMRSINIDMSTIKLCSQEMLERYKKIEYIKQYVEKKKAE
ncbi:MAG: mechanosensitive ion channel, partial [Lentisphaeria bacterium]